MLACCVLIGLADRPDRRADRRRTSTSCGGPRSNATTPAPTQPFSYAAAWRDAGNYLRGDLAIEQVRSSRWAVVTADGTQTLGYAKTRAQPTELRDKLRAMIALDGDGRHADDNGWQVVDPRRRCETTLATFDSEAAARARLDKTGCRSRTSRRRQRSGRWLALVLGHRGRVQPARMPSGIARGARPT